MYSAAGPGPTQPSTAIRRTPESRSHAVIHPERIATISHERGVGKALPCSVADFGSTVVKSGREARNPESAARSAFNAFCNFSGFGVGIE